NHVVPVASDLIQVTHAAGVHVSGFDLNQAGTAARPLDKIVDVALGHAPVAIGHAAFHRAGDDPTADLHPVDRAFAKKQIVSHSEGSFVIYLRRLPPAPGSARLASGAMLQFLPDLGHEVVHLDVNVPGKQVLPELRQQAV